MSKLKCSWEAFKCQQSYPKKQPITPKEMNIPSFEENFKIYLRVKPIPQSNNRSEAIKINNSKEIQIIPPYYSTELERVYQYEEVFGQNATNEQVFQKTMQDPIANILSGYNSTVFIYGMTGAGKTYTMFNSINDSTERCDSSEGIVGMSINRLFDEIKQDQKSKYQVMLSFYQIYNENIKDLLCDSTQYLNIMEDPVRGVFINQLREVCVETQVIARAVIQQSLSKRSNNATKNNEYSSRSHAILQFTVRKFIPQEKSNEIAMLESKLFLIDLAGNEKAGQNENKRFIEGVNINKSLLTLGKCINILSEQKKPTFIPFRDSKLTRILKDSLGGNSKTVMIACISPESRFYEQTLNTIKYSTKARRIKNKGKGANIKLINKKQMPKDIVNKSENDGDTEQEEKLYLLINQLQNSLEQKIRIEKMREQLQQCYYQNEAELKNYANNEACQNNLKQINELLPKLNLRHNAIENSIDDEIRRFMVESTKYKDSIYKQEIISYKLKLKEQNKELEEMKRIINEQKHKIHVLSQQNRQNGSPTQLQSHFGHNISQTLTNQPQQTHKISTPTISEKINHSNHILIHESNGKSQANKKISNIQIVTSKNSRNKENVFYFNDQKRSNTPQSSMASSKILSQLSRVDTQKGKIQEKRQPSKPTINISMENIKLKSPIIKFDSKQALQNLITKDSVDLPRGQKEEFLVRLKEMDKNMQNFTREQVRTVIQQSESSNYELNKMQRSMINKLKFIAKTNDKHSSLSKDHHIRKDRSLMK